MNSGYGNVVIPYLISMPNILNLKDYVVIVNLWLCTMWILYKEKNYANLIKPVAETSARHQISTMFRS